MAEARRVSEIRTLNVAKDFRGMPVLAADTGEKLGETHDAIIRPTEGCVVGLVARTRGGDELWLRTSDFFIGQDAVMTSRGAFERAGDYANEMAGGVKAVDNMVGASVVTEDGRALGRISEIYIRADQPRVVYRVAESTLQKFFGKGFFLTGNVPRSFAPDGSRIIVPADTDERYATASLAEAL